MYLRECHWSHYEYLKTELVVPPMALTEEQVVVLFYSYGIL